MKPILPSTWPPIIAHAPEPRSMLWRDRFFTAVMWLLLAFLCRHTLSALWMTLTGLFAHGHLPLSGWHERWARLRPYLQLVALFGGWELFWILTNLWRRQRALRQPPPPPLALAEEARNNHRAPAEIAQWRHLKICTVHFDAESNPSVQGGSGGD